MVEVLFWSTLIVVGWKFIFPTTEWGDICKVVYGFDLAVLVIYLLIQIRDQETWWTLGFVVLFSWWLWSNYLKEKKKELLLWLEKIFIFNL